MKLIENNGLRILIPAYGYSIKNKKSGDVFPGKIYLGKFASFDDFEEVENNDVDDRLMVKIREIDEENESQNTIIDTTLMAIDEVYTISDAENQEQFELIDTTLLAMDEIFMLMEPILAMVPMTTSIEREVVNPMVELYVVMVQRGLKSLDQVPARYREQVAEILNKVVE